MTGEPSDEKAATLKDVAAASTFYLMPADRRRLKMLAASDESSVQTIMLDAIDMYLASRGEEPVTRWEPRRKPR